MPTPRSIPSVTPRELESLKSNFLSEISSLKASLSGKEAEAASLKTAVGDAEKRVGECMEQLRELQGSQGSLKAERDSWEKRCREMEVVLRQVKAEIVLGQREREELEFKLSESESRRNAAEEMAQAAESKMAGMRAGKASAESGAGAGAASTNKEVEIAVERVARDLHALYKQKHETKVNALKKSYSSRWEKKVAELQGQVDELARDNEELRVGRDATLTRVDLARIAELEDERRNEKAEDAAHIKELEAEINKLEAVTRTVRDDNNQLRVLLERERVEKGELVILAEEMMNMQAAAPPPPPPPQPEPTPAPAPSMGLKTPNKRASIGGALPPRATPVRNSVHGQQQQQGQEGPGAGGGMSIKTVNRMSGLRAPGTTSKIGRMGGAHERTKSNAMARPGSGLGSGSGIMTSIEKMGNYRGRD
ncbi:central kinetochore-associated-domain-containing protein [Schizothecium vesticola]|uniref:Central kinetochore-associated-domain-containing protein n=1 Tax=Schizothecium vesticola TaxID=314040 RepID=A0AA40K0M1_9PEZI|nr:central kinetochore-associated-domain-containing protein [Schizothecium vesticola]